MMKKQFLKVRQGMKEHDQQYIDMQKNFEGIEVLTYNYLEDNEEMHKENIYFSSILNKEEKHPLIIDIHGGGWIYGDKDLNGLFAMHLAEKGYIVMTMSYRLLLEGFSLMDMLQDINNSIKFLLTKFEELNIDKDRVYLTGDSAGGHLALLLSAIYNSPFLQSVYKIEKLDIKFKKLVLNHPAPFVHQNKLVNGKFINKLVQHSFDGWMYGKFHKKHNDYIYADVENFYKFLNKDLPTLIISSKNDTVVKYQYFELVDLYKTHNLNHETYFEYDEDSTHVYNVTRSFLEISKKCNDNIVAFLEK